MSLSGCTLDSAAVVGRGAYALLVSMAMNDILRCYVSGRHLAGSAGQGTVSFAVPDYGILFRCQAAGARADLEMVAFLALLRFIEHNRALFKNHQVRILTDFPLLVYLMQNGSPVNEGLGAVRERARQYGKGIDFAVEWIDEKHNRAGHSVADIPAMPAEVSLKVKSSLHSFAHRAEAGSPDWPLF